MLRGALINEFDIPHSIVMEASTSNDRKYMRTASKDEIHQINGTMINTMYKNTVEMNKCDFGDIPKSNGDITKLKIYDPTVKCLAVLGELLTANSISEPRLGEINNAIKNCKSLTPQFEMGFRMKQDFVILLYNTTVMAIIDSTSMMIASYMDYIIGPDQEKYTPTGRFDKHRGEVSLENLTRFNTLACNGKLRDALDKSLANSRNNFTGTEVVLVMAALLAIVPLTRELIFFYNRQKLKISDYLDQEVQFLEMHELAVKASRTKTSAEKREILEKQRKVAAKLCRFRDKLQIQNESAEDSMRKEVKQDNSLYTLQNIEKASAQNKLNGSVNLQFI
ncbi:MAG: hypothetical protein NC548_29785 [Lachnospiraceae bacterium]|nr:hypothetical protein [Lachnospiraceae bacterium]